MKKISCLIVVLIFVAAFAIDSEALTVTTRAISGGTYEDGKFSHSSDSFEARYIIDEIEGTVRLDRIIENNREGKMQEGAEYDVTNISVSEGISALLVSRNKKGQKIITAVREADLGVSEILIIGEDFYEYCRAANGKFYLEYGEVIRRIQ